MQVALGARQRPPVEVLRLLAPQLGPKGARGRRDVGVLPAIPPNCWGGHPENRYNNSPLCFFGIGA